MDRVGADQQIAIARLAGFGRELGGVVGIEVGKAAHHRISGGASLLGGDRLKQAPAHDLEALVACGGPPLIGDAGDHIFEGIDRLLAVTTADLIDALGHGDQQQGIGHLLDRLGERLGKGHLRIKGACRQIGVADQVAGVGHPFIHQDQAGGMGREQGRQILGAGGHPLFVTAGDEGIALGTAELIGELAPEGVDDGAIGIGGGLRGAEGGAHQYGA